MTKALNTLRAVQWAMLTGILLSVALSETLGARAHRVDPTLSYVFSSLAVGIVGTIFVVRRTMVLRAAAALASSPDDGVSLAHWRTGYIVTYALCEALALFGLVLHFVGAEMDQSLLFYVGGLVLLLFFRPRAPAVAAT